MKIGRILILCLFLSCLAFIRPVVLTSEENTPQLFKTWLDEVVWDTSLFYSVARVEDNFAVGVSSAFARYDYLEARIGYISAKTWNEPMFSLGFDIKKFAERNKVQYLWGDFLQPSISLYAGYDWEKKFFDYGASLTLVKIKL